MKGIAHFVSGICTASFVPGVVAAVSDRPWLLPLGGAAALLPDLLDFRATRFFEVYDEVLEIGRSPGQMDPQDVAERLAAQVEAALNSGRARTVRLHTFQLGPDLWQAYTVRFSQETSYVMVELGPAVNTAQQPLPASSTGRRGRAPVGARLELACEPETTVDILSGPSFQFVPTDDGVRVEFLPWHRRWSHSLVLALCLGLAFALTLGWQAGAVVAAGLGVHILEDQLGHMGSNLFWPLSRRRRPGLCLFHSGDAAPNLLAVWLALILLLWNLDRFALRSQLPAGLLAALSLPIVLIAVELVRSGVRSRRFGTGENLASVTEMDDWDEV